MAHYGNIKEEELKNKVGEDLFPFFDTTQIIGNIDFSVSIPSDPLGLNEPEYLLWAEAKKGTNNSIQESFIQLILTLGKERPQDKYLPPAFLGAFDAEKIAFLPYNSVLDVLAQSDFNWNVTPSNHQTKEFKQLHTLLEDKLNTGLEIYDYDADAKELLHFIKHNFHLQRLGRTSHIRINKNNFVAIYLKWLKEVKPTIANVMWDVAKKKGIIDADFYLADILSEHNTPLREKLFVVLRKDHYELDRKIDETGLFDSKKAEFTDQQKAHTQFWNRYERPPRREYWDYIVERRDLLVPQDVRERKGSYFTPARWVELSQQYLAEELGENWQDEYIIWDCCAGTGNLLAGLTNKWNIWASTLDKADVDAMRDRIRNGANLLDSHVFQFDFLNDPFTKLPQPLQDIINDPHKRKKLVIYINPPYAEAGDAKQLSNTGKNKTDVAVTTSIYAKYKDVIGIAGRELFAQFFIRIYSEIPTAVLAEFSTLKILQAPNFSGFRTKFRAKLGRKFLVPADTFDNVKGKFPIGFFIWHTDQKERFETTIADVYNAQGELFCKKTIECYDYMRGNIGKWVLSYKDDNGMHLGFMSNGRNDFQNQKLVYFINDKKQMPTPRGWWITPNNLIVMAIFVAVRHCIEATWLNDRDQFLYPSEGWIKDQHFQNDCLAYTLFSSFNTISNKHGVNHWIPFTEYEVDAKEKFQSHFMSDYINGKNSFPAFHHSEPDLFATAVERGITPMIFSPVAQAVLDAGRELWRYYHLQLDAQPNASFYDIRLHFQGTKQTKSGKTQMNTDSSDMTYTTLLTTLRQRMKVLAEQIVPKVYEYGFLKK